MIKIKNIKNDSNNISAAYKSTSSSLFLLKPITFLTSLFDEVNNYLKIMKKGVHFDKIINSKGRTTPYELILSEDEKKISMIYDKCCVCKNEIDIEKITSCEFGHSNNFYSSKKFENFFTIELKDNQTYEFYHQSQLNTKYWVNGINYLIQKKKGKQEASENKILSKEDVSKIWQQEVIPNWTIYRKYLHDKNKENYFTKKVETNKKRMDKHLNLEENIEIIKSNNQEILYLWGLGLPTWLRNNLWSIVIGNELDISKKLFEGYTKGIFSESNNESVLNLNKVNKSKNNYLINEDLRLSNNKDDLINDLKVHVHHYYKMYESFIPSEKKNNFETDIYLIVRSFCNYRQDVLYIKDITLIASIIYLNSDNNYDAFRIFCNLIISSCLFNYIQNDVSIIRNYYEFFEYLIQKYTPLLYNYIISQNFPLNKIFYKWTKNLFLKVFPYNINLIIFDNFIIRGKIFIFQVALAILIINQKELIKYDINKLYIFLKKSEFNIDEYTLFDQIDKLDIRKEYEEFFDVYELGKEKIELFHDL